MKTSFKVLILFSLLSVFFITGSVFGVEELAVGANLLLIPTLILYYRYRVRQWFLPVVVALLLFYTRDFFLMLGYEMFHPISQATFSLALIIFYLLALLGFQKSKVHLVEYFSLAIMYGFLSFLFVTVSELVSDVVPSYQWPSDLYLILLILLLAFTFTSYLFKSHYASLWMMIASASLLVSELSLFFKIFILADVSVNIFFPFFHVITYYALVQHAVHRRRSRKILGGWF